MLKNLTIVILSLSLLFNFTVKINAQNKLNIYAAAGLIKPMEEIIESYHNEFGTKVSTQFNASGVLLNQINTIKKGDLYIAADKWYINKLYEQADLYSQYDVAKHTPVIIKNKNNNNINNYSDILLPNIRLVVADESAAIGKVTKEIFIKNNIEENIEKNIIAKAETVNKVKMYILLNQADAGIVWKANYFENTDELDMIKIPKNNNIIKKISIGVLKYSGNKKEAEKFIEYIKSSKSIKIFEKYGYNTY
ncbi:MAG: molybdate ABC transporter substrate-binding protein [Halanaerobiales bacterium]|nr:molybdate ABC transporter substrate-binding protein [Halanaerobiales bacterium]